jgi:hypothetical protein
MSIDDSRAEADPPSRIAWPPLLLLAAIAGGALLDLLLPLSEGAWPLEPAHRRRPHRRARARQ